ncbi:hypothetical protein KJ782_00485 [Patescibacteria group bacterium]|nr:hypothetical protein [Patescibacteria group bacterium]
MRTYTFFAWIGLLFVLTTPGCLTAVGFVQLDADHYSGLFQGSPAAYCLRSGIDHRFVPIGTTKLGTQDNITSWQTSSMVSYLKKVTIGLTPDVPMGLRVLETKYRIDDKRHWRNTRRCSKNNISREFSVGNLDDGTHIIEVMFTFGRSEDDAPEDMVIHRLLIFVRKCTNRGQMLSR